MLRRDLIKPAPFTIRLVREWAPLGHDRFLELVKAKFFNGQVIYRTLPGFLVQFGVAADPAVQRRWQEKTIADDEQRHVPFTQGTVSFAGNGEHSRSTHIFIALAPSGQSLGNAFHERPFGRIDDPEQQKVVANFFSGYGDITALQGALISRGNAAAEKYPRLDRISRCFIETKAHPPDTATGKGAARPPGGTRGEAAVELFLDVEGVGSVPIRISRRRSTGAVADRLMHLATKGTSGRIHRAEGNPCYTPINRKSWQSDPGQTGGGWSDVSSSTTR